MRCTCSRRTWPKCPHPWHLGFHHGGKEWRYSLDKVATLRGEPKPRTKGEAQAWADTLRGEIRNGIDPIAAPISETPATGLTFGDIADRYLVDYVGKIDTRSGTHWSGQNLRQRTAEQAAYHIKIIRRIEVPAAHGTAVALGLKPFEDVTCRRAGIVESEIP